MSGKRHILLVLVVAVGLAVGFLVVRQLRTPRSTILEQPPPPPPAVEPLKRALQADAEGRDVPGYRFSVGRFRVTGFGLRAEADVTFAHATYGTDEPGSCLEPSIN